MFLCSFLSVFEQVGTVKTIKNTAQGSKNSECRKSKKIGPGPGLGWILESFLGSSWRQMWLFCRKNECKKTSWKKVPPKSETGPYGHVPGLPDSDPKVKDFSNKNNNWARSNNNKQQFNNNTNNCRVVASVRLLLCLFLVRFLLQTDVVSVSCSILNVVAEPVIWHALSKARRIF